MSRFANPKEYGEAVLSAAGCTCDARTVQQVLDASGAFAVEHYHKDDCEKTINSKAWQARSTGSVPADVSTQRDRHERRMKALGETPLRAIPKERAAQA
jgi:hypothetical protein